MDNIEKAVIKTLIYSDCFNYPLLFSQVFQYLISEKKISATNLRSTIGKSQVIKTKNEFYYLKGRSQIIFERKRREKISIKKLILAKQYANILSYIPLVRFIGVSGSLAMKNAIENDDIDFFVISSKNRLWLTRLFCNLLLILLGVKRKRVGKNHNDKVCLNMFMDISEMAIPINSRNLYSAHEVIQLLPIINKQNTYEKFLQENSWILDYMPNSFSAKLLNIKSFENNNIRLLDYFEIVAKKIQIWYMRKHKTIETIRDKYIAFHPEDLTFNVIKTYEQKCKRYDL